MATKIKRSQFKTFINLGTYGSPVWELLGDGVTAAAIQYNPKITEETYIHDDSATISVDSYAPKLPIEGSAKKGDAVFDLIDGLRKGRLIGAQAEVDIVNVWLYETPSLGFYSAERQAATISVEEFGGEGGIATKMKYTVGFIGNPVIGAYSPADAEFVALPLYAILTTMVIGAVTLSPLFATNHAWLHYAGSVPNGTSAVSMTSTLGGATIVQYDEGVPVSQGQNASLAVGINHLTIDVTLSGETVTYVIDITRAAS